MANLFNWFKKDQPKNLSTNQPETTEENAHGAVQEDIASSDDASQTENLIETAVDNLSTLETVSADNGDNITVESDSSTIELDQNIQSVDIATIEKPSSGGFFSRLKQSLSRTKESIGTGFVSLFAGKKIDSDLYEQLETQLLIADVGIATTAKIINSLTESAKLSQLKDGEALYDLLKAQMKALLQPVSQPFDLATQSDEQGNKQPFVILMVGVNGVGKTTTIGKLAKQFQSEGKKVMLAAGDTFRAAAVEQLQVWGERNNIPVVAQQTGSDSASVIFDALASAKAKGVDVLIADTAGRLQNKQHLIEELKKIVRVMKKINPDAPHEVMLTLDASTGQNAVSQTKIFNEAVGISGINVTKLDGTAKGGIIFSLADQFGIPIRYIGIGEGIDDLRPFEAQQFVDALFSQDVTE
ncbi:MAG: fused signal recognition particle receptor [Bermanella sp.]|jgi:fused signal recognition particle receptor|uniref:signal recognition particle-docking protein FtsY n=1 Tax=Glaciecola sp. 33A TaxID=2057807 RepID=UPI000C322A85|nr:signal recognition particle-docking protein FtsY [Glaciecola sp. 33A]PKI00644.1 signal recognition particle-docking protein FtsY [Glaciecola sp. 33A]